MKSNFRTDFEKSVTIQAEESSEIILLNSNILRVNLVKRWLKFAGVANKSMETYNICIKQLARYFAEKHISAPKREDLENWRDILIESGKSASTISLYLTAAKLFFRWLAQEGIYPNIADNLKNRVKVDRINHKKDALSISQAKDLQRAIKGKDIKSLRDRAIIALMLSTGARSIEVVRANIADIRQIEGHYFLFLQGKGRSDKSESVLIAPKVYGLIQAYLKARGKACKQSPLFVSTSKRNKDARLDTQTIRKMIKFNLRQIGIDTPTITCHSLRHTAASVMIQQGEKLYNVQMVLRHKSIATTMIYNNTLNRLKNLAEITASKVLII
jgi:integrase/recombinase XerC